tara:strand:+ start:10814 stop:11776 length:963 start_codon:yes stop_codon:yes gene_type:complete
MPSSPAVESRRDLLYRAGEFYEAMRRTELAFKEKLGPLHTLYLLKQLAQLPVYGWRDKLSVLRTRQDPRHALTKRTFSHRYELLAEYYERHAQSWRSVELHTAPPGSSRLGPEALRCFFTGAHEIFFQDIYQVEDLIRPGDVVVDGGANVGMFSMRVKESIPDVVLHCFEPEEHNRNIAAANLARYQDVHMFAAALGGHEGKANLRISNNSQVHSLDAPEVDFNPHDGYTEVRTVAMQTIDDTIAGKVDVIKLDIEGAEQLALIGAKRTIAEHRPTLIIAVEHSPAQKDLVVALVRSMDSTYEPRMLNEFNLCLQSKGPS